MHGNGEDTGMLNALMIGALAGAFISAPLWLAGVLLTCAAWVVVWGVKLACALVRGWRQRRMPHEYHR